MKKSFALAAVGLGAAYLLRNKDARNKISKQFENFTNTPMRGEKPENNPSTPQPAEARH